MWPVCSSFEYGGGFSGGSIVTCCAGEINAEISWWTKFSEVAQGSVETVSETTSSVIATVVKANNQINK